MSAAYPHAVVVGFGWKAAPAEALHALLSTQDSTTGVIATTG
jgi:hypothetical protein